MKRSSDGGVLVEVLESVAVVGDDLLAFLSYLIMYVSMWCFLEAFLKHTVAEHKDSLS